MPSYRVAALESGGKVLLAALTERQGTQVLVTTEDGRSFPYPEERMLWSSREPLATGSSKREVAAALQVLRARAAPGPEWDLLRRSVPSGEPLDLAAIAGGDLPALAIAARAGGAAPHFRIEKGRLVAATAEEVRAEAERGDRERRRAEAEEALVAALAGGKGTEVAAAAGPALDSLLEWALGPEEAARPRIAERLSLAEPDDALERLDAAGLLPADAIPPLSRRGIPREFPRKARREAEAAAAAGEIPDAASREDLRDLPAFALDDPGTFEVDDAVSMVRGPGGEPRLLVHISDVAAAVPPGGALDLDARARAVTVYLPETKVPMFPPSITEARLSLAEGRERAAITAEIAVGPAGEPVPVRLFRSRVRVTRRLDYGATGEASGLPEEIRPLHEAARALRRARVEAGARVLEIPAAHLRVRDGVPVLEIRDIGGAGDVLVGEAMIAFNRAAAARLREAKAAVLWRLQDPPRGDLPPAADPLFSPRARRLFSPVRMSMEPGPHAGLGVDAYLQATSPIRRYPDLLHQRQLAAVLAGQAPPHPAEEVRAMATALWQRERLVRQAEAAREDYWMAILLESRRAETFEGFVDRAVAHGRGHAWVPALLMDVPFRWGRERGPAPSEGTPVRLKVARLAKHRGRIEFEIS